MSASIHPKARARGFTLVELMVAMTIGLVLALAVSMSLLAMGQQFRTVGANSSAQVNAQLALSLIDNAGRMAGAGLYSGGQPLCPRFNAYSGTATVSNGTPLLAARITDGGSATASDTLVFTFSSATGPLSGMPVVDAMVTASDPVVVSEAGLISLNDMALVGVPGSATVPCTLFKVTTAPTIITSSVSCGGNANSCKSLERSAGGINAPIGTFATEPRYGFATGGGVDGPAIVLRLGDSFRQEAFRVMCQALVQYNAFTDAPTCTANPLGFGGGANALATDVVLMQAQYGVSNTAASDVVTAWVEATGATWGNPTAGDAQRIKAIRVVIVTRSKEPDPTNVTAASCTNAAGVTNTGPCSFDDAAAPVIDVSATPVPASRTWRNYRYRVQQAVIPLRTVIWSS